MRIKTSERPETIEAVFIAELSNRFRCLVKVDEEEMLCYVPSSCRLSNLIDLTGRSVLLTRMSSRSKIKYCLFAVETNEGYVLLNLALANKIVYNQIGRRYFSFLGKREHVRMETVVEGYKSDLFIEDTKTVVEIKTVLSLDPIGHFPTVYSKRLIQQLKKIETLLDSGYRVCYMLISLGPQVRRIYLDSDRDFTELIDICISKGMILCGYALQFQEDAIGIASKIKVFRDQVSRVEYSSRKAKEL